MKAELMIFGFEGDVLRAYALAVIAHKDDVWHGKEPYYLHCGRVGKQLQDWHCPIEIVIAGVLHEIIDDGHLTADDLLTEGFSEYTVALIEAATPSATQTWETHIDAIVASGDVPTMLIRLADLNDNSSIHPCAVWDTWDADLVRYTNAKIRIVNAIRARVLQS